MDYRPLGNTGLTVSVAGLGCGGNSRLGLGRGASFDECVSVVHTAIETGVTFLDTAEAYGTEEIVGAAVRSHDRTKLVISTKAIFRGGDETATSVTAKVEASLKRLGLDHVDIFHFHAVGPEAYVIIATYWRRRCSGSRSRARCAISASPRRGHAIRNRRCWRWRSRSLRGKSSCWPTA